MTQHLPFPGSRIAVVAITRHGIALAGKVVAALPGARLFAPEKFRTEAEAAAPDAACYTGKTGDQIPALFAAFDGIVCIVSLGAVVRLIAPYLKNKEADPGIVVIDEAGHFVIPMLSGHLGGANALAGRLATALDATPVLTTASDSRQTLAVDLLGRELGWTFDASHDEIVRASAAMVNDEPVALVQE
ncbi:MAG: cobalamin biosynthesis protein CbiG, partial [Rugosibacter sp.]